MVRETRTIENDLSPHEKDQGSEKRRAAEHHSGNVPPPLQSFRMHATASGEGNLAVFNPA